MANITVLTPPAVEPVSLTDCKSQCRIDFTDDDTYLAMLITAARQLCENEVRRTFCTTTYVQTLENFSPVLNALIYPSPNVMERLPNQIWGVVQLYNPPVQSVTSVTYTDTNGNVQTLATNAYETQLGGSGRNVIVPAYGTLFPASRYKLQSIAITYVAGYGDATTVPVCAKLAMLQMVAHWYRNREAVVEGSMSEMPMGVSALLDPLRWGSYV